MDDKWRSSLRDGLAFLKAKQYPAAIDAFNKSRKLKEDWASYQGLGWAFTKTRKHKDAIYMFKKSF